MTKEKNISQSENIEVKKFRAELWLGIVNLILTAIVGIGITVFLNYRDEKVQKNIIALQAETERQADIANLQVSTGCVIYNICDQGLEIVNLGPAPAKKIKVAIVINDVKSGWETVINDIEKFSLKKFPPTLDIKLDSTKVDVLFENKQITGNNSFELSTDNLPAGEKLQAVLDLNPDLPVEKATATRDISIYYENWEAQTYFMDSIGNYFANLYTIANFSVYVSCDNCLVNYQDDGMIQVSAVGGLSTKDIAKRHSVSEQIWMASLTVDYKTPLQVSVTPINYPLYFKISNPDEKGRVEFTEISKP